MKSPYALLLSACLGVLSFLNFAPQSIPLTMVIALAGLFALIRAHRFGPAKLSAGIGLAYGLAFMGPTIWWMNLVDVWAWVALVGALAAFFSLVALGLRIAARLRVWPLAMAVVWALGESARGRFPLSGFPWARLAHTALDTPFESYVRLIGMAGTTALLAMCSALIAYAWMSSDPHHSPARLATISLTPSRISALGLLAAVIVGVFLPIGLAGNNGERTVAVVQGGTPGPFLSWPRGEIFNLHLAETARIDTPIDFVVWPENAIDIDPTAQPQAAEAIKALSESIDAPILVGGIFNGPTTDTAYNVGEVWDESGPGERYLKQKVVPYGEYVPLRNVLGPFVPRFDRDIPRDIVAGDESAALAIAGTYAGATICWDIAYDSVIYDSVMLGAEFLVVQTSNASFEGSSQPEQQFAISRLRAIETGRYVLVPSTSGISGVIDPSGRVVAQAPLIDPTTLIESIELASSSTPAVRWAQSVELLVVVAGMIAMAFGIRQRDGGSG